MRISFGRSRKSSGLSMLVAGIVLIVMAVKLFSIAGELKAIEKKCTAVTTGVVTNVEAQKRTSGRKSGRRTYYVYFTEYVYSVDGMDIHASKTFGESSRLNMGDEVAVHYNPDQPTEAYAGASTANSFPKGVIIGVLVLGIVFVLVGFRLTVRR